MKKLTAATLAALMLLSAAGCAKDDKTIDTTTATTATTATETTVTTETTAETTVETTEAPVDLDALLEGYTVYDVTSNGWKDLYYSFTEQKTVSPFVLRITDIEGLYLFGEKNPEKESSNPYHLFITKIMYGGMITECDFDFFYGPTTFTVLKSDDYVAIGEAGYFAQYWVFGKTSYSYIPDDMGRDGSSLILSVNDVGELCYRSENPIITATYGATYKILEVLTSETEWRNEWGIVTLENGEVIANKIGERTVSEEGFLAALFGNGYGEFETIEELLEYNKKKK